jgi:hypothetical protein
MGAWTAGWLRDGARLDETGCSSSTITDMPLVKLLLEDIFR